MPLCFVCLTTAILTTNTSEQLRGNCSFTPAKASDTRRRSLRYGLQIPETRERGADGSLIYSCHKNSDAVFNVATAAALPNPAAAAPGDPCHLTGRPGSHQPAARLTALPLPHVPVHLTRSQLQRDHTGAPTCYSIKEKVKAT